jgi:nucleotide-binding universal stress UspA family protein
MTLPHTMVVPLDGSTFAERAVPVARELARRIDAHVLLMTTHWDDSQARRRTEYLESFAAELGDVPTEVVSVDDHPNAPAIEHVLAAGADRIVCMTSHGRGRLSWAVLGSIAEEVVRQSRRPMVVIGRHCRDEWPGDARHLLVCVDGKSADEPVVPVAVEWAKALGLDVQVAVVVHPLDLEVGGFPREIVDAIVARFAAGDVHATPVALRGSYTSGAIADYAGETPVALIAMNTHARGVGGRLALGSVAMGTVGLAVCPVLVVPNADEVPSAETPAT